MKPETHGNPSWASERVEDYLDGLLNTEEKQSFEEELEQSFALREETAAAKQLRDQIRALPIRRCPDRVTEQVLQRVQKQARSTSQGWTWPSLPVWLQSHSSLTVLTTACAAILILVFSPYWTRDPLSKHPTPGEVRAAERQIDVTMAYLARVGARTGAAVQAEVYRSAVVVPIQETVRAISQTGLAVSIKSIGNKES